MPFSGGCLRWVCSNRPSLFGLCFRSELRGGTSARAVDQGTAAHLRFRNAAEAKGVVPRKVDLADSSDMRSGSLFHAWLRGGKVQTEDSIAVNLIQNPSQPKFSAQFVLKPSIGTRADKCFLWVSGIGLLCTFVHGLDQLI